MSTSPHHRRAGFTLVEAAVSTVIVGTMVAAAVSVVGTAARGTQSERSIRHGQTLARAMMAEVLSTAYADPDGGSAFGLDSGESHADRTTLDDVDDFNGLSESWPTDHLGQPIPWAKSWVREVSISNVAPASPDTAVADNVRTGLKRVTIKVASPEGRVFSMVALKSSANIIDSRPPALGSGAFTRARFFLQVGERGSLLVGGVELYNTPSATLAAVPQVVEPEPVKVEESGEVKK